MGLIDIHRIDLCDALPCDPVQQGFVFEAGAVAFAADIIAAVAGQKHAHRHFVGSRFQPAEKSLDTVIGRCPLDDGFFLGRFQIAKRDVCGNFLTPAEIHQFRKFHAVAVRGAEGFNGAVFDGKRVVRYDEIHVYADGTAKAAAGVTSAHGAVERK